MRFPKRYAKGLFATATIVAGSSPTLSSIADKSTELLHSVGLDWSQVIAIAAGAPLQTLIPSLAIAALPYLNKIMHPVPQPERDRLREEIIAILKEDGHEVPSSRP